MFKMLFPILSTFDVRQTSLYLQLNSRHNVFESFYFYYPFKEDNSEHVCAIKDLFAICRCMINLALTFD